MDRKGLIKLTALVVFGLVMWVMSVLTISSSKAAPRPRSPRRVVARRRAIRRAMPKRPPRPVIVARRRRLAVGRIGPRLVVLSGGRTIRKISEPVVISIADELEEVPTMNLGESTAYKVTGVNDECTVVVEMEGRKTTVRMIGVETDLSGQDGRSQGGGALDLLRNLLVGEFAYLEFDSDFVQEDADGNKMAYIRRAPDALFVNLELLRQGCALADVEYVYQHQDLFSFYESKAQADGKGIWQLAHPSADQNEFQPDASALGDQESSGRTASTQPAQGQ